MESIQEPKNRTDTLTESKPTTSPLHEPFRYDLVIISWLDASGKSGWKAESELEEDTDLVTQIGFLIKKTRSQYILAAAYYQDEDETYHVGSWDRIPRSMVKSFKVICGKGKRITSVSV